MKAVTLDDIMVKPKRVDVTVHGAKAVKNSKGVLETPFLTFWCRASQQPERDLAAAAARKESRTLRKKLETDGTEERQRLVLDDLEEAPVDSLRALWVSQRLVERAVRIRNNSLEDREYVPEPEGDFITGKDVDDYENEVEEVEETRERDVFKLIEQAREELIAESEQIPESGLMEVAIPSQIEHILTKAYESEFVCQLILRCTFTDKKLTKRAFTDIEQVYALKDHALTKLTNVHMSFLLDPEQVKNLAGGLKF